jgi:hypothetical protein
MTPLGPQVKLLMASKMFGLSRTCHSMNPTVTQIEAVSQEANHHQNSTVTPKRQEKITMILKISAGVLTLLCT